MTDSTGRDLLAAALNLSHFHREHEKFYASEPRAQAVVIQRHARTLHALADRWDEASPSTEAPTSPFAGADDLTDAAALQLDGVLFMEGEGRPAELGRALRDLSVMAEDFVETGQWLGDAMEASWGVAAALAEVHGLEDLIGERHRIIANDWLASSMSELIGRLIARAVELVAAQDLDPAALRADLSGPRRTPAVVHSAAEMLNRAADLCSESATLVNDNERRWRLFHGRVATLVAARAAPTVG